jgi:hypothetical protein
MLIWLYNITPNYLKTAQFSEKVTEYKMCFIFLYNFHLKYFSFYEVLSEI